MSKNEEVKVEYYDNGNKKSETHYKDGELNGVSTSWHQNGTIQTEMHYKDGKKNGLFTFWYEDGTKFLEEHYKNGKRNGVFTWWYETGEKWKEEHYKNGKEDGVWISWFNDGTKWNEEYYKDGKEIENMTYERYKTGTFRVCIFLTIILWVMIVLNGDNEIELFGNYIRGQVLFFFTPIIIWTTYFFGKWIAKGFIGKK
jgi:hypothetical protein